MRQVNIQGKQILVDGEPMQFRSGAMHYFRIHPAYWTDRLTKLKQCGLNTVETYLPWNLHEEEEGVFNFSGRLDFERYVEIAASLGLKVILRPGPYICSEWDFGGLPAWLLAKPGMRIRCCNRPYLEAVERYFAVLLPKLQKLQWTQGGPVVLMQIENEYGVVGNDTCYLRHLYDLFRDAGIDIPLFISDWGSAYAMECGSIPETMLTVNCPSHPGKFLDAVQQFRPDTPEFIMELWSGVSHRWNASYLRHEVSDVARDVEEMLRRGNSFNFYMFHGGSSLGFMNGALNIGNHFEPYLNSYDVDAPLNEAGDPTDKYFAIQRLIKQYCPDAEIGVPIPSKLQSFPSVTFSQSAKLFEQLSALSEKVESVTPEPMEFFGQNFGFILYRSKVSFPEESASLSLMNLADKAWVYANGKRYGVTDCNRNESIVIPPGSLDIIVENQGRINSCMGQAQCWNKGLDGVLVHQRRCYRWEVYPLPLKDLSTLKFGSYCPGASEPCFHRAEFEINEPADTYIRIPYGTHGQIFLNGENLGRYRVEGPGFALYAPAPMFKKGKNELIVFELEGLRENKVEFIDYPDHAPTMTMIR
ncbi:MAG: beta-galactosidase [Victivallales bacterium]|jgi:beta-galactosidase|nr:beta-galactosidase [Victivallales bacterium]